MMYYPSLVIIFIKRTDRSQKRYFLWQILERDREGLGGGRWRRPHTGWDIDNLRSQPRSETENLKKQQTSWTVFYPRQRETSPVRSDILIKTFQSDTSQFSGLHTIILSHHQLVSQDKHPDTAQPSPAQLTGENISKQTENTTDRRGLGSQVSRCSGEGGEQSYKVELELLTGSPRYLVRNCFQISLPGW